jgi:hypothetical protein
MSVALTESRVPRKGTAPPGSRGERRVLIEFSRMGIVDKHRRMAEYKDMPPTVMLRSWIMDRLREEERRLGWEPHGSDQSWDGEGREDRERRP